MQPEKAAKANTESDSDALSVGDTHADADHDPVAHGDALRERDGEPEPLAVGVDDPQPERDAVVESDSRGEADVQAVGESEALADGDAEADAEEDGETRRTRRASAVSSAARMSGPALGVAAPRWPPRGERSEMRWAEKGRDNMKKRCVAMMPTQVAPPPPRRTCADLVGDVPRCRSPLARLR
jgi:hypothetical protein